MVALAATIATKSGKILVSRQFTNITKFTLEEYIKSFPKLIQSSQQHTFVENDSVRYVYIPLETMYLVLITNKNSNIIEDLETIRFLQKAIIDVCSHGVTEATISKHAFDILLATDDIISSGYRESITMPQLQVYLAMESSEEKLHLMLQKAKQNEALEAAKKHQAEMMKKSKDATKFSSAGYSASPEPVRAEKEVVINEKLDDVKLETSSNVKTTTSIKKGLQLGKPKKQETSTSAKKETVSAKQKAEQEQVERQIQEEEEQNKKHEYNPLQAPVLVEIEEKLKCDMSRDGALNTFEVIGDVFLTVRDPSKGMTGISIEHENNKAFKLSLHPSLNKVAWNQKGLLVSKESDQSFPIGLKIPTIKYRFASTNVSDIPINFTYWYSDEGALTLEAEFQSEQERIKSLTSVSFIIGFPAYENPQVKQIDNGDFEVDSDQAHIKWIVHELSKDNSNANVEIQFSKKTKVDDLFPMKVEFTLASSFYKINSPGAISLLDQNKMNSECITTLTADNWLIQ